MLVHFWWIDRCLSSLCSQVLWAPAVDVDVETSVCCWTDLSGAAELKSAKSNNNTKKKKRPRPEAGQNNHHGLNRSLPPAGFYISEGKSLPLDFLQENKTPKPLTRKKLFRAATDPPRCIQIKLQKTTWARGNRSASVAELQFDSRCWKWAKTIHFMFMWMNSGESSASQRSKKTTETAQDVFLRWHFTTTLKHMVFLNLLKVTDWLCSHCRRQAFIGSMTVDKTAVMASNFKRGKY